MKSFQYSLRTYLISSLMLAQFMLAKDPAISVSPAESRLLKEVEQLAETQLPQAITKLQSSLEKKSSAPLHFVLARLYERDQQFKPSENHYLISLQKAAHYHEARFHLSQLYTQHAHFRKALKPLHTLLQSTWPQRALLYQSLGMNYYRLELYLEAETAYRQALLLGAQSETLYLALIQCLLAQKNYPEASSLINQKLALNPHSKQLWLINAQLELNKGNHSEALIILETGRRLNSLDNNGLLLLADLYFEQKLSQQALQLYLSLAEQDPNNIDRLLSVTEAYLQSELTEPATKLFNKLNSLPLSNEQRFRHQWLLAKFKLHQDQVAQALKILNDLLLQKPLHPQLLLSTAQTHFSLNDDLKALLLLQRLERLDSPLKQSALLEQAKLYVKQKKYDLALAKLDAAMEIISQAHIQRYANKIQQLLSEQAP